MHCLKISKTIYEIISQKSKQKFLFDSYEIGTWFLSLQGTHNSITSCEIVEAVKVVKDAFRWISIRKIVIEGVVDIWENEPKKISVDGWLNQLSIDRIEFATDSGYQDIGYVYFDYHCCYENEVLKIEDAGIIHISFDKDKGEVTFILTFNIDLFTFNPARQPDVFLSIHDVSDNQRLLEQALKSVDDSVNLRITGYESDFHPNLVTKYGFSSHL